MLCVAGAATPAGRRLAMILAVVLAAGRGTRFGGDKMAARVGPSAMLSLVAGAVAQSGAERLLAVLRHPSQAALLPPGYTTREVAGEMSDSLRAAVDHAEAAGADHLLIALGDMPFVPVAMYRGLIARVSVTTPSAASIEGRAQAPACFPRAWFPRLRALEGDRGAGVLLQDLPQVQLVHAVPGQMRDIDRPADI
ncbi:MAG: nucleotidyltransferase family protein [Paracoccus sp. (in: a-proteobacteria)]|nr:nucleotidyltransferase family protein [Paracoccus sp. (in: a-proteobacteria)]